MYHEYTDGNGKLVRRHYNGRRNPAAPEVNLDQLALAMIENPNSTHWHDLAARRYDKLSTLVGPERMEEIGEIVGTWRNIAEDLQAEIEKATEPEEEQDNDEDNDYVDWQDYDRNHELWAGDRAPLWME